MNYTVPAKPPLAKASASLKSSAVKGITAAEIKHLALLQFQIGQIGSKSTEAVFELGDKLLEARTILGPKGVMPWATKHFSYTPHHINSFVRISEHFEKYRSRMIQIGLGSTVLIELLKADDHMREAIISRVEKGEKLGVAQVRAIIAGKELEDQGEPTDPEDIHGPDGYNKLVARKAREERQAFKVLVTNLRAILEIEATTDGNVDVTDVIYRVGQQLAYVSRILETTIGHYSVVDSDEIEVEWNGLEKGTFWSNFYGVVTDLRDPKSWAKADIKHWLQYTIVPYFKLALGVPLEDTDFAPEDSDKDSLDDVFLENLTSIDAVPALAPEDQIFDGLSDEAQGIIEDAMETSVDALDDIEFIEEGVEPDTNMETFPTM